MQEFERVQAERGQRDDFFRERTRRMISVIWRRSARDIDAIDEQIQELIAERARCAQRVAEIKLADVQGRAGARRVGPGSCLLPAGA
jgi:hypothetical protein